MSNWWGKVEDMTIYGLGGISTTTGVAMRQLGLATATVLALATASIAMAQQTVPVTFARGQSSATLTGRITGDQDRNYTVDARAGQTLTVTLKATRGSVEMNVWAPGSDSAISLGSADPYRFSTVLPSNGRYRVQVYQMRAFARRGATANYALTIGVTGRGGGGGAGGGYRPSVDALVPGTKYNATADLRCTTSIGGRAGACKAGVIRGRNGNTVVEIKTPDGGQRSIFFTNGRATSSDASAPMRVTRQGDVSIVRIGNVEVYEIVDAFVVGG